MSQFLFSIDILLMSNKIWTQAGSANISIQTWSQSITAQWGSNESNDPSAVADRVITRRTLGTWEVLQTQFAWHGKWLSIPRDSSASWRSWRSAVINFYESDDSVVDPMGMNIEAVVSKDCAWERFILWPKQWRMFVKDEYKSYRTCWMKWKTIRDGIWI